MIISTFNIQNDYKNYKKNKSNEIVDYIKNNKIDIIGLQELPNIYNNELANILNKNYKIYGKYRYKLNVLFQKSNEKNPIITNQKVLKYKTYYLPSFPSYFKRIMTWIIISYKGKELSIYNTHLEVKNNIIKKRQLNKIYKVLSKDNRPKILMGDFNITINNEIFKYFINKLETINIERININNKTYKNAKNNLAIDHIFKTKDINIISSKTVLNLEISDHYPLLIEID